MEVVLEICGRDWFGPNLLKLILLVLVLETRELLNIFSITIRMNCELFQTRDW